ncbi:MAG: hypothetical protein WAL54_09780 [Acinetobacter bohemicus]
MKKISTFIAAGLFTMLSATAFACPQGTTLAGGSGPNHKGGKCVPATAMAKQDKMMKQDSMKTNNMADKSHKAAPVADAHKAKTETQKAAKTQ